MIPNKHDIENMRYRIQRAQHAGTTDYYNAEQLLTVLDTYETMQAVSEKQSDAVSALADTIGEIEDLNLAHAFASVCDAMLPDVVECVLRTFVAKLLGDAASTARPERLTPRDVRDAATLARARDDRARMPGARNLTAPVPAAIAVDAIEDTLEKFIASSPSIKNPHESAVNAAISEFRRRAKKEVEPLVNALRAAMEDIPT